ncbi:hypothetical protein PABG_00285 [Paracoccidioides brasiliensis Pb03]|nr:hypothetical protein PABG_00285 [Paracoccidioides brasiliensis Pb03]ODH51103.1 hypothetical protein GX48_02715 [Paracoccidioides brasiliensis]
MRRSIVLFFLGTSAIVCTVISTIINGVFAASFDNAVFGRALVAYMGLVVTVISSIILGLLILSFTRDTVRDREFWKSWRGLEFIFLGIILCIDLIVVAICLWLSDSLLREQNSMSIPRRTRALYSAWCGVWIIAIIFQASFYIGLALPQNYNPALRSDWISRINFSTASFLLTNMRLLKRTERKRPSVALQCVASLPHQRPPTAKVASHYNPKEMDSKSSRYSGTLWPSSHLLKGCQPNSKIYQYTHKFQPHRGGSSPLEQEHTFDQWDTSSVPREIYDALLESTLQNPSHLNRKSNSNCNGKGDNDHNTQPQTQSRSRTSSFTSTATTIALSKSQDYHQQSPQPPRAPHEDSILPESPTLASRSLSNSATPSSSPSSSPSAPHQCQQHQQQHQNQHWLPYQHHDQYQHHDPLPLPPPILPTLLSSQSMEGHIHPLFRSSSPGPRPATSKGTVVVASPAAGQTITKKALSRIRSGSFSSFPVPSSPLAQAEIMESEIDEDNENSDGVGNCEAEEFEGRAENGQGEVKASEKPIPLPMPIPRFVLAEGNGGRWLNYERKSSKGKYTDEGGGRAG